MKFKLTAYPTFTSTPFTPQGLETKTKVEHGTSFTAWREDGGEGYEMRKQGELVTYIKDSLEFRKVFVGGLATIKDLQAPALRVWCFILMTLKPKRGELILDVEKCMTFTGYGSIQPIYDGLGELVHYNLLARSVSSGIYYINPNIFFNGNRTEL